MDLWATFSHYLHHPGELRLLAEGHPHLAPWLYIAFQAAQVVLAPIPGEATGFLAGYLFGPWRGLLYSMTGITLGSSIAFFLAKSFRGFFWRFLAHREAFKRLKRFMEGRGILAAFVCYLIPGFPKDYLSYFLGLFEIPYPIFLVIMFFGRLPATLALSFQGAAVYEKNWPALIIVTLLSLAFFGFFYLHRERVYQYLEERHGHRLS